MPNLACLQPLVLHTAINMTCLWSLDYFCTWIHTFIKQERIFLRIMPWFNKHPVSAAVSVAEVQLEWQKIYIVFLWSLCCFTRGSLPKKKKWYTNFMYVFLLTFFLPWCCRLWPMHKGCINCQWMTVLVWKDAFPGMLLCLPVSSGFSLSLWFGSSLFP